MTWLEHRTREMPCGPETVVQTQIAIMDRTTAERQPAFPAKAWNWRHRPGHPGRVIFWRRV